MRNILLAGFLVLLFSTVTSRAELTHVDNGATISTKTVQYKNPYTKDQSFEALTSELQNSGIFYDLRLPPDVNDIKRFKLVTGKVNTDKTTYYVQIYQIKEGEDITYGMEISTHYDGKVAMEWAKVDLDIIISNLPLKEVAKESLRYNLKLVPDRASQ